MTENQIEWSRKRDELVSAIKKLGFPKELGEMLAICSDIDIWHNKKAAEEANARYNEMLYYGLGTEDEEL